MVPRRKTHRVNNNLLDALISAAKLSAAHIYPHRDRPTRIAALAVGCFRSGRPLESAALLESALAQVDPATSDSTVARETALTSIADALRQCGRPAAALEIGRVVSESLSHSTETVASLQEAMLAMLFAKLCQARLSKDLAARIVRRGTAFSGFLRRLTLAQAFRVYVALGDFERAEELLQNDLPPDEANVLELSALDLSQEFILDAQTRSKAAWLEQVGSPWPAVLAILMLWYAQVKERAGVARIWQGVRIRLAQEDLNADMLRAASISCLGLRNSGREEDAQALLQRILRACDGIASRELDSLVRADLVRTLTAFGELPLAAALDIPGGDDAADGTLGVIVSQLIRDDRATIATSFIESAGQRLAPRLLCLWATELLRKGDVPPELGPEKIRSVAAKIAAGPEHGNGAAKDNVT